MGSFVYTDFVTNFPIQENEKVVVFLIGQRKEAFSYRSQRNGSNVCYIDELYEPMTLPFIMTYDEYGRFVEHPDHTIENDFAIKHSPITPGPEYEHNRNTLIITDGELESILDKSDIKQRMFKTACIAATNYSNYKNIMRKMRNTSVRQGIFQLDTTYRQQFEKTIQTFADIAIEKYDVQIITKEDANQAFLDRMRTIMTLQQERIQPMITANFIQNGRRSELNDMNMNANIDFAKNLNNSLFHYALNWNIFQSFLEATRTVFTPVAGMGSQDIDLSLYELKNDLLLTRIAREQTSRDIEISIADLDD